MQNLRINPEWSGKVITKDLGYTTQRIEVDKLKPSQFERVYKMGFKEIFLTDGEEREHTSNKEVENIGGTSATMGGVQKVEKKPSTKRANSKPKN